MSVRKQHHVVFPSAARTATAVSPVFNAEEVVATTFVIDVTAVTATPSVVITVEGKDPVTGKFWTILTDVAITATGTTFLQVGKDIAVVTQLVNIAASQFLPAEYRLTATHADTDSITYSVTAIHMIEN
jgi:hypothetical protein